MLKEAKYFCPKCGKQDIVVTVKNGAIMLSEDFSPSHFVNYKDNHWRCSSCDYKAKGENFFIAERTLTDIEEARELITSFICKEYKNDKALYPVLSHGAAGCNLLFYKQLYSHERSDPCF